jgi:glyoxalase family protein
MQLNGLHHVTAVSAQISRNADFYTRLLGLRLVKKSVNQDDTSAYHLFYADKVGTPGTDMTFFDWPQIGREKRSTDSVAGTAFRVNGHKALSYWIKRFDQEGVPHHGIERFAGRDMVRFEDPEGQRLLLVDDEGAAYEGVYWPESKIPEAFALRGFYASILAFPDLEYIEMILTRLLNFERGEKHIFPSQTAKGGGLDAVIFTTAGGGPGKEIWLVLEPGTHSAQLGAGGVHHIAFRVADEEEHSYWRSRLLQAGVPVSQQIDRYYFKSIYFRISNGILFEIATDGPGFATDEDVAHLGETLALPPFLEHRRAEIEANLKPIDPVLA